MKEVFIDFSSLGDMEEFYEELAKRLDLPEFFGNNLDALSDFISGFASLPLHVEFVNLSVEQLEVFEDLINTLEELEDSLQEFTFSYYLEQYEE